MTQTGAYLPSRGERCEFQVFTTAPVQPFAELGTIDVQHGYYGGHVFSNLTDFKTEIEPYVCRAGGDGAIALANGLGMYIKASVIKLAVAPPQAYNASPPPMPIPANPASGCQFDTQCKGERVCVHGECTDPEKR